MQPTEKVRFFTQLLETNSSQFENAISEYEAEENPVIDVKYAVYNQLSQDITQLASRIQTSKCFCCKRHLNEKEQNILQAKKIVQQKQKHWSALYHKIHGGFNSLSTLPHFMTHVISCCKRSLIRNTIVRYMRTSIAQDQARLRLQRTFNFGATSADTLDSFHQELSEFVKNKRAPSPSLLQAAAELRSGLEIQKQFDALGFMLKLVPKGEINLGITNFAYNFISSIRKLPPNEAFMISCGAATHAVVLEIQCSMDEQSRTKKYRVLVHNTGEGAPRLEGAKTQAECYDHCSEQEITQLTPWMQIWTNLLTGSTKNFYSIIDQLTGKKRTGFGKAIQKQGTTDGSCTYSSILLWLKNKLTGDEFDRFEKHEKEFASAVVSGKRTYANITSHYHGTNFFGSIEEFFAFSFLKMRRGLH
jgi:hypothetical protein